MKKSLWNEKWLYITTGILCCIFMGGSFHFSSAAAGGGPNLVLFSICVNFATNLVIFMAVALLMRRDKESYENERWQLQIVDPLLKAFSSMSGVDRIGNIEWASLIESSQQIEFLVQSWKTWPESESDRLHDFFERGGVFHLFTYNPTDPSAEQARQLLKARKPNDNEDPSVEINGMVIELKKILQRAGAKTDQLKVIYINEINWYCAVRFTKRCLDDEVSGRDVIVFSLYSHMHETATWRDLPAFLVYPDISPMVARWFDKDLNRLNKTKGEAYQK